MNIVNGKELAEVLKVHPETVKRMAKDGRIPVIKVGTENRFDVDEVIKKLKQQ